MCKNKGRLFSQEVLTISLKNLTTIKVTYRTQKNNINEEKEMYRGSVKNNTSPLFHFPRAAQIVLRGT